MRPFLSGLLAVLVVLASPPAAQGMRYSEVDPRSYASPSGEYELYVDPSARDGSGPATYRLSKQGSEVWTTTHPFTWTTAFVCDDGASAGYRFTPGWSGCMDHEPGSFEVAVLDPKGTVRVHHAAVRADADGLIPFPDLDRFVVRVADDDWNRQSETWCPYRISTGESLATFRPKVGQPDRAALRDVLGAVRVRGTPLVLVHWHQVGEYEPPRRTPMGARFALVDESGASVWTLDLPEDCAELDDEQQSAWVSAVREREHGSIARWDEARRFDLDFVRGAERVTFEVLGDAPGPWMVREVARRSSVEAPAAEVAPADVKTAPPPRELALVGVLDLETSKSPPPFVRDVRAFAFDGAGNVAFLRWQRDPQTLVLAYADARGARIAEHVLPPVEGEQGQYVTDLAWLADDRFVVGWSASSRANPDLAKIYAISARTGALSLLAHDVGHEQSGVASAGDGRFVALGDNRLDAFDADGKRLWKQTSADGLCGADGVAVLADGRVVVFDRSGIQWIAADGKLGRYDDLEKRWGRKPRYLCGIEAGPDRGLVLEDSDVDVFLDAGGKPAREIAPRFRDGHTARFAALRAGPGDRIWTSDGHAILGLDASGQVEVVLGEAPDVVRLDRAAYVALDREDRIHAVAERTGDVHVIDFANGPVRVLRVPPGTFTEELSFVNTRLAVDDSLGVTLTHSPLTLRWASDGALVANERREKGQRAERPQPGTENRFVAGPSGLQLVGPTGSVLAKFERKPDGQWLKSDTSAVARDGSIAFLASRDKSVGEETHELVLYAADGTPRAQVPVATNGAFVWRIAYDGARVVLVCGEQLCVHDVASGVTTIHALPGIEGRKTDYWTPLLPRTRDEVWLFDGERTVRRYTLPRR